MNTIVAFQGSDRWGGPELHFLVLPSSMEAILQQIHHEKVVLLKEDDVWYFFK